MFTNISSLNPKIIGAIIGFPYHKRHYAPFASLKSSLTSFHMLSTKRIPRRTLATFSVQEETKRQSDHQPEEEEFDWCAHWWPVLPICCLDKQRPQGIMILGVRYVVWWNTSTEQWCMLEDRCPHRLAPLSEGRVMPNGDLMCSYHGRTFNGCGKCTWIPQAPADFTPTKKLDAAFFPLKEVAGLLFAWLQPGEEGAAAAAAAPPPVLDGDAAETDGLDWGASNVPNDYQFWVEQAMDPTHAPYLHHERNSNGAGGILDQNEAIPFDGEILPPSSITNNGFVWQHGGYSSLNDGMKATRSFVAPNCVSVTYLLKGTTQPRTQHVFVVPVAPGKARIFYRFHAPPKTILGRLYRSLERSLLPHAVQHSLYIARRDDHAIADQDIVVMHLEEAIMRNSGDTKDQYMANLAADRGVMGAHRWLGAHGKYQEMWSKRMPNPDPWKELPLSVLFDRWKRHVGHCAMCQQTMQWGNSLMRWLFGGAGLSAVAGLWFSAKAAAANTSLCTAPMGMAVVGAVILGLLGLRARNFVISQFVSGLPRYGREGGLSLVANKPIGPLVVS